MRIWACSILIGIHFFSSIQAAVILKGDANAAENETFSFAVEGHTQNNAPDATGAYVYVSARYDQDGNSKEYAVARVARGQTQFVPLAPEKVNLDPLQIEETNDEGKTIKKTINTDVANPIYDNGILFLSFFNGKDSQLAGSPERPVVVINSNQNTIFVINQFSETGKNVTVLTAVNPSLLSSQLLNNVPSATAFPTNGIVGLTAAAPNIFAAVKPNGMGSSFGDAGSGIALVVVGALEGSNTVAPTIVDAQTYSAMRGGGNRAVPLDITSDFLKTTTADLVSIGQVVDLHWNPETARLYIALQVTGGANPTDGARAIAVGRFTTQVNENDVRVLSGFELREIVPATVFDGAQNKIVGAVGSSAQVSIHKVRSMYASTSLSYLIGVGGVGSASSTRRSVFALPLVLNNVDETKNGTIAAKDADPESLFFDNNTFMTRVITEQAQTPSQMPLAADPAVQVGGGDLVNGDIIDIHVFEDTVWVTVQEGSGNQQPGIFYSHALFDDKGKINGWTIWQREAGTTDRVVGMEFDPTSINKTFLSANSSGDARTVKQTRWGAGEGLEPVVNAIKENFSQSIGGVQGVADFVVTSTTLGTQTPGLANISLMIATGLKKVMFVETSRVESGVVKLNQGSDFGGVSLFDDGTLNTTFPNGNKIIVMQGGVLDDLGPITAAEVARDGAAGSNGYIIVGGVGGAAILSQADGSGWDATTKLDPGFDGLVSGMAFKKFGDYSFVRKIINDGNYLYVLTNTQLDRIDLTTGTPGLGIITPTTLAQAQTLVGAGASFLDCVISQKLAILATSKGLLRIGDAGNIQTDDTILWQPVATPEAIGPVRQLIAQSTTGRAQDISKDGTAGILYALSAYSGKNQAQFFRYRIAQTETAGVASDTVVHIPDMFVKDISSYFASFGFFKNILATDGSVFMGSRSRYLEDNPIVTVLAGNGTAAIYTNLISRPLLNRTVDTGIADTDMVNAFLKLSSSGSWLIGTNVGMQVNE